MNEWLPGNKIGDEGAKGLSEMMKMNKTLTSLDLTGKEEEKVREKGKKDE